MFIQLPKLDPDVTIAIDLSKISSIEPHPENDKVSSITMDNDYWHTINMPFDKLVRLLENAER